MISVCKYLLARLLIACYTLLKGGFTVTALFFFVLVFGLLFVFLYTLHEKEIDLRDERIARIKAMDGVNPSADEFKESKSFISYDHETKIAIDEVKKKVCIWAIQKPIVKSSGSKFSVSIYDYSDILSVDIIKGSRTVTSTSRKSQVGGALLGGLLAGGVGAVIGGLSGSTTTKEGVNPVDLRIIVNDFNNPYHKINFYTPGLTEGDGLPMQYIDNTAMPECNRWYSILSILIRESDEMDNKKTSNSTSLTEELLGLNELKKQGILTQDEFEKQKSKILKA